MPRTVPAAELATMAGTELPPSDWLEISQDRVNQFADATSDHQFIHIDAQKAQATPFGGTIAHGFLTLSLVTHLASQHMLVPEGTAMTINYGSDKVRYLTPVKVGQRIRLQQSVVEVGEKRPGQWLVKMGISMEIDGESAPAMIAEILFMHFVQ